MQLNSLKFYRHVSDWIRTHVNPDTMDMLRDYVQKAAQPADVKEQLFKDINDKEKQLRQS